ncbi:MAG TPA: DUF1345 domain-containing protein [Chthoniobacterales bacterium]|jgi:uncharacterized membrane protein|nr:DUF1345 domain-containing protein [Chthoniobacterales bacterium]
MTRLAALISRQDARHRVLIALVVAVAVSVSLRGRVHFATELIATWDAFAFCVLLLAWFTILTTPIHMLRGRAKEQDLSRLLIFIFVVVAACAALFAVAFLISINKTELQGHVTAHLLLALGTVIFSWSLVHTVFGLRYAHTFYGDSSDPAQDRHAGGLIFPEGHVPDYFDFAYFSFVVGMTFQVSDVQITSRRMRRLTLLHSVLAFGFNTVILALLINTVSSLL